MKIARIVAATGVLVVAGAVAGALVGLATVGTWLLMYGNLSLRGTRPWLVEAAIYGGVGGALFGPPAAWLLMRHVPLGRAIGGTAAATYVAALLGLFFAGPYGVFHAGLAGFGLAVLALRFATPRSRRGLPPADRDRLAP